MSDGILNKIFGKVLRGIKSDPEVSTPMADVPILDKVSVPCGTFAPGQPFKDSNGVEHELYCNSHPSKKHPMECDCSARFTDEREDI